MFIDIFYSLFINSDCVMLADWNLNAETMLKNSITYTVITQIHFGNPFGKNQQQMTFVWLFLIFMLKKDYKYEL